MLTQSTHDGQSLSCLFVAQSFNKMLWDVHMSSHKTVKTHEQRAHDSELALHHVHRPNDDQEHGACGVPNCSEPRHHRKSGLNESYLHHIRMESIHQKYVHYLHNVHGRRSVHPQLGMSDVQSARGSGRAQCLSDRQTCGPVQGVMHGTSSNADRSEELHGDGYRAFLCRLDNGEHLCGLWGPYSADSLCSHHVSARMVLIQSKHGGQSQRCPNEARSFDCICKNVRKNEHLQMGMHDALHVRGNARAQYHVDHRSDGQVPDVLGDMLSNVYQIDSQASHGSS